MSACTLLSNGVTTRPIPDTWAEQYALAQELAAQEADNPVLSSVSNFSPMQGISYYPFKMSTSFQFISARGEDVSVRFDHDKSSISAYGGGTQVAPSPTAEDIVRADAARSVRLSPEEVISDTFNMALPFLREHGATMAVHVFLLLGNDVFDAQDVPAAWSIAYWAEDRASLNFIIDAQTGVVLRKYTME